MLDDPDGEVRSLSPRNQVRGVVTRVVRGRVMASVELAVGTYRFLSLMDLDEARGLEPGMVAVAWMKAVDVVVGIPG